MNILNIAKMLHSCKDDNQLRVLCSAPSYPQLSNSYIHTEIVALQRLGVHVNVWSERKPTFPSTVASATVHRGSINAAIRKVSPHIIYGHWLNRKEKICIAARKYGVPIVLRGHSFEFSIDLIKALDKETSIRAIYLFPHQIPKVSAFSNKIRKMNVCYDKQQYQLYQHKEPRIVVRAAVARPEQDLELFIRVAKRLPDFQFILILCNGRKKEAYLESLVQLNRNLGNPVEIMINQQYGQVVPVVKRAVICLHTNAPEKRKSSGMPVFIAEAMATGCYILTPDKEGAREYIGDAGLVYENEDQVVQFISETENWNELDWKRVQNISSSRALQYFSAELVMAPIVDEWRALANLPPVFPDSINKSA